MDLIESIKNRSEKGSTPNELMHLIKQLYNALLESKEIIRIYHGEPAWEIYEHCSPEMKRIRAALQAAAPWLRKEGDVK